MDIVTLAHGSGGINAAEFVQKVFMPYFKDLMPYANEDCGIFSSIKDMKICNKHRFLYHKSHIFCRWKYR